MGSRAGLAIRVGKSAGSLNLIFDSQSGTNYQFEVTTNFLVWEDIGGMIAGDGSTRTQMVSVADNPKAFFRLSASPAAMDVAPTQAEFTAAVVGKTILGYLFVNSTHFTWSGEPGLWDYTKTGSDTGKLVFTYDEDGNNANVYREEVLLTFQSSTQGNFRYSEYNFGTEDTTSIDTGPFDLGNP